MAKSKVAANVEETGEGLTETVGAAQKKTILKLEVDPEKIREAVAYINEKANQTLYTGSIEIGEYILKEFYNDDEVLASSRDRRKPATYRQLCKSPELAVPAGTLCVMVRVAAQERFFAKNNIDTSALSYTHKAELVKLAYDSAAKQRMIKQCIEKSLSTRQLADLVMKERKKLPKDNEPTPVQFFAYVERVSKKSELPVSLNDADRLRKMTVATRNKLKDKTQTLLGELKVISDRCESLIKKIEEIESM